MKIGRIMKLCLIFTVAIAAVYVHPGTARAGIEACGNIYIDAEAQCEVIPPGVTCTAECTPISVQAACAADLEVECEGMCTATLDASCTASCQGGCEADCEVDPGTFDCRASCQADCDGHCEAACSAADDQAQCAASCEATCSGSCDGQCEGTPPSATCAARCEASCSGSCEAQANLDCQVDCQQSGYVDCVADIQGGCETACMAEDGALFCDGQFIDYGGNLDACVAALRDLLDIEVDGYASGECSGNMCSAEAGGSASCAIGGPGTGGGGLMALFALATLALVWPRRRRQR